MKIHEYQAKELCAAYGIPVQPQLLIERPEAVDAAVEQLGLPAMIKAQVLVGGRGKAGGVKFVSSLEEARAAARAIFGLKIKGLAVEKVLVTPAATIEQEFYVALALDRAHKSMTLMMSAEGGVEIEELARERSQAISRLHIDPLRALEAERLQGALAQIFPHVELRAQAAAAIKRLYAMAIEKDCSLVEINPYALIAAGSESGGASRLVALDAKINFDDNALFRHPDIEALKNPEEYSADEIDAKAHGLSFVSMDGDIGCIVNGAGLAMATMDLIQLSGGEPANFLDVGGSSNPAKVLNALRIITANPRVKAILINIFGGITRCDDIAQGIIMARHQLDLRVPLVIRLIGTNEEAGRRLLAEAGLDATEMLTTAVERVVAARG